MLLEIRQQIVLQKYVQKLKWLRRPVFVWKEEKEEKERDAFLN